MECGFLYLTGVQELPRLKSFPLVAAPIRKHSEELALAVVQENSADQNKTDGPYTPEDSPAPRVKP